VTDQITVKSPDSKSPDSRLGLSRRNQALIMGGVALLALGALARTSVVNGNVKESAKSESAGALVVQATADGVFRPSETQWANLRTATAESTAFHTEHLTDGKIAFNDDKATPVYSPYSGRISQIFAKPGQVVKKGDPLFSIHAAEFVQGQNDLIATLTAKNKANKQLDMVRKTENRQHELYLAKAGSLKDWELSQTDLTSAENDLKSAGAAVGAVRNRLQILGKSDQDIQAIETTQLLNPEVTVTAPLDGTIIQRKVGPGQYIQAGASDPQFTIGDLSTVWLVANVRETDAPLMRLGEPVEVRLLAYPGKPFSAKIAYVAPSVDPTTHRLPVRAEVNNPDGGLKPEMYATFSIASSEDVNAPAIPLSAVIYEGEQAHVWMAVEDGGVVSRAIRCGRIKGALVEVLDGVKAGEKVVTSGALFVDRAAQAESGGPKS
jgi:cobalt-zinc-cadmium efflux system membrane fusion protein